MTTDPNRARSLRDQGINAYRSGDHARARSLLEEAAGLDMHDEHTFLWLSAVLDSDEERRECLEHVLTINPENQAARNGLEKLGPRPSPTSGPTPTPAAPAASETQPMSAFDRLTGGPSTNAAPAISPLPSQAKSIPSATDEQQQVVESLRASVRPARRSGGLGNALFLIIILGIVGLLIFLGATGMIPAAPGALLLGATL